MESQSNIPGKFSHKPLKIYKCKFCTRKFVNPRALGGHQNAHKKEKGMLFQDYYNQVLMATELHHAVILDTPAVPPSINIPNPEEYSSGHGKAYKGSFSRFQEAWRHQMSSSVEEATAAHDDQVIPIGQASFHVRHGEVPNLKSQQPDNSKSCNLDLDLHL